MQAAYDRMQRPVYYRMQYADNHSQSAYDRMPAAYDRMQAILHMTVCSLHTAHAGAGSHKPFCTHGVNDRTVLMTSKRGQFENIYGDSSGFTEFSIILRQLLTQTSSCQKQLSGLTK